MVDCYADADFAGLWGHENPQYPICARSRTRFVVTVSNFPLLWVSRIQTYIAFSTIHYEYVALSYSVRALIPLKSIIREVIYNLGIDSEKLKFVLISNIYEDNNGAIVLEKSPGMNPTSKHISIKYHWSRQKVGKESLIHKIESENQNADIFTKGLQGEIFVRISKLI